MQRREAVGRGRARRSSAAAARAPRSPPASSRSSAIAGIYRPALARAAADPRRPGHARWTSAPTWRSGPSTSSSSPSWAPRSRRSCSGSSARGWALLSNGEEPGRARPTVVEAHAQRRARPPPRGLEFVGNVEGTDLTTGAADVVVTDGFTGNVALKVMEGTRGAARRGPRRGRCRARARRSAALLLRPALRRPARRARSRGPRRRLPARPAPARRRRRTGASAARASRRRSCWPPAAPAATSSAARTRRSRRRAR